MNQFLIRRFPSFLLVLLFISTLCSPANAEDLADAQKSNTDGMFLTVLDHELDRRMIKCFDVRDDGWFAIGYRQNVVHIYNANGDFAYGYRFQCDGDYGIAFDNDFLTIYLVRGDIITAYDDTGNCVYTKRSSFSNSLLDKVINKTEEQIGSTKYILERDIGLFQGDYSRLVAIDQYGVQTVLYDVTNWGYFIGASHYILLISFVLGFAYCIYSSAKRILQEETE